MPPDVRHLFVSPVAATNNSGRLVQGPNWNETHNLQQGPQALLGRSDNTPGQAATTEVLLDPATLTFSGGKLTGVVTVASISAVSGRVYAASFGCSTSASGPVNRAAIQAALDVGGEVVLPTGTINLENVSLVPHSNTTIFGVPGTILARTGNDATSYTKPFFNVEDVHNVTFDGVGMSHTLVTSREYAIITRSTTLGLCNTITVRNCTLQNCALQVDRFCAGVTVEDNLFDGGGANGAIVGMATGGSTNKTTGGNDNLDGTVKDVFIHHNRIRNIRGEGIDINQDTTNVTIDGNSLVDCQLAGDVTNEAIDIGGVNSTAACHNIVVSNNNISWTSATNATAIRIKLFSQDVTVTGNTINNPMTATSGLVGIHVKDACRNVTLTGNSIRGFNIGIALTTSTTVSENINIIGNVVDGYGGSGININTGVWDGVVIKGNTIQSTLGRCIDISSVTRWSVDGNMMRGAATDCMLVNATATDGCVTGNYASGAVSSDGIRVLGARCVVSGNTAYLNGRNGINIGATNVTVTGNQIYNNSQVVATQAGLNFQTGSHYCTCVGNSVFDTQGTPTQNGIAIAGALTNMAMGTNNIGPVKTTALVGFGNMSSSSISGMGTVLAQNVVIAAGVITCSNGVLTLNVDTEAAAATDDLDTITYTGQIGDRIMVAAISSARDVVLKHNTGNMQLGADFTLNNANDAVLLQWNGTLWRRLSSADNGI